MLPINPATLTAPVRKGQSPLSASQFQRIIQKSLKRVLPDPMPTQLTLSQFQTAQGLNQFMMGLQMEAQQNNIFNHQLHEYRKALATLAQPEKAKGRAEVREMVETGEVDDEGNPVTVEQVTVTAIEALPKKVTVTTFDPNTGETKKTRVKNPDIIEDEAKRAAAKAVVDTTPQEVIDYHVGN